MKKEKAKEYIEKNLSPDDSLIGFFAAQQSFKIWLFLLIGPLAVLSMKSYFVAVTRKGIYFHRLNLLGKFSDYDFFEFTEIETVRIAKGTFQRPMKFNFKNGRNIEIKAQVKGLDRIAKLTEETLQQIQNNIKVI